MIGLPRISEELYSTARVLRVFVTGKRFALDESRLREIVLS
jgi:hypothetical protein